MTSPDKSSPSPLSVRVAKRSDEAIDIRSFELVSADGSSLPRFTAGSHVDVHTPGGPVRQYSLCLDPADNSHYRIAVKKEPESRGGSRAMHETLDQGHVLTISAPRNNFALDESAEKTILMAGGIGITPILSMALRLEALGKPFELQYFSRSVAHTAFHELLSQKKYASSVKFHYALDPVAVRAYLRKYLWHRQEGAHLYICGPRPFMDLVEQTAAITWPPESVHLEYFTANPEALAGPRETFIVRLARSGGEYRIPADHTIVETLAEHGVHVETSCEQGVCGTCLTGVMEGLPDHRDVYLTDEEREAKDRMCCCVSRALTDVLVLDL
jgi:vanillate O-demethylase ferredoxin subunit